MMSSLQGQFGFISSAALLKANLWETKSPSDHTRANRAEPCAYHESHASEHSKSRTNTFSDEIEKWRYLIQIYES